MNLPEAEFFENRERPRSEHTGIASQICVINLHEIDSAADFLLKMWILFVILQKTVYKDMKV